MTDDSLNNNRAVLVNTWLDTKNFFDKFSPQLINDPNTRYLPTVREYMSPDRLN